jgi:hypothetical protein
LAAAREAVHSHASFHLIDVTSALKVDLFVLGHGLLDRMQIARRILVAVPGAPGGIWVTAAEVLVLRKLDRFRGTGSMSDRQWRDVVGILRVQAEALDHQYLEVTARTLTLADLRADAMVEARTTG